MKPNHPPLGRWQPPRECVLSREGGDASRERSPPQHFLQRPLTDHTHVPMASSCPPRPGKSAPECGRRPSALLIAHLVPGSQEPTHRREATLLCSYSRLVLE